VNYPALLGCTTCLICAVGLIWRGRIDAQYRLLAVAFVPIYLLMALWLGCLGVQPPPDYSALNVPQIGDLMAQAMRSK